MLHLIEARSEVWGEILWNEREGEKIIWTVSVWSQVVWRCPLNRQWARRHGQKQCDTDTFRRSTGFLLIPPAFTGCSARLVGFLNLFSSLLFSFWYCAVSCLILFLSDLFSCLSHTAFFFFFNCSVVLSSIKEGEHVTVLTSILCARLRLRHFLSRGSLRNRNTELKVQANEYSTSEKQAGWQKEKCVLFFFCVVFFFFQEQTRQQSWSPPKHTPDKGLAVTTFGETCDYLSI